MNKIRSIAISLIVISVICSLFVLPVHAASTTDKIIYLDSVESEMVILNDTPSDNQHKRVYLYVNQDTPLTFRYFLENPDFSLMLESLDESYCFRNPYGYIQIKSGQSFAFSSSVLSGIAGGTYDYGTSISVGSGFAFEDSTSNFMTSPIYLSRSPTSNKTTPASAVVRSNLYVPETPEEDEEDDGWSLGSFILDGIRSFFRSLFAPILDLVESVTQLLAKIEMIWEQIGSLEELWEKFKGYTIEPLMEFFESINLDSLSVIMSIWEFPIIGDFSIGKVALLFIGGILILMITF